MVKPACSPRKSPAKSTRSPGPRAAKSARSAKSAPKKVIRKTAIKSPAKRGTTHRRAKAADGYMAALDGWCRECTARLRKLVHDHRAASAKAAKTPKSSRRRKRHGTTDWIATGARRVGLGLRRGAELADPRKLLNGTGKKIRHIKFNRVTDFCKTEWKELAALASRLNELASSPPPRERRRRR